MKRIYTADYKDGNVRSKRDPEKGAIMAFIEGIAPVAVAAGYFNDAVTGDQVTGVDNMGYVSGPYSWCTEDVYHFERYDLELDPDFREYALSNRCQ